MNVLLDFVVVLHVLVCLFLIGVVLLAAGPLGRSGGRLRRAGFADRIRPSRRGQRAHPAHYLVGDHLHVHLHHPDDPLPAHPPALRIRCWTNSKSAPARRRPSPASREQAFYFQLDSWQTAGQMACRFLRPGIADCGSEDFLVDKIYLTDISSRYEDSRTAYVILGMLSIRRISPAMRFTRRSKRTSAASGVRATDKSTPPSSGWPPKA